MLKLTVAYYNVDLSSQHHIRNYDHQNQFQKQLFLCNFHSPLKILHLKGYSLITSGIICFHKFNINSFIKWSPPYSIESCYTVEILSCSHQNQEKVDENNCKFRSLFERNMLACIPVNSINIIYWSY